MKQDALQDFPYSCTEVEERVLRYLAEAENAKSARNIYDNTGQKGSYHSIRKACEEMAENGILEVRDIESGNPDKLFYLPKELAEDVRVETGE